MAKLLDGLELQGFIQERQLRQVRNLIQEHHITPRLLIVMSDQASAVIETYVRMKRRYADEIGIAVEVRAVAQEAMRQVITEANSDQNIQGIIVQLPLERPDETEEICGLIAPEKDVDGLGKDASFPSATAQAIDWLLAGYGVSLEDKKIAIVGRGKLVGRPLEQMWSARGLDVTALDDQSNDTETVIAASDMIVTATGVPRLIRDDLVRSGAIVVDAGTASEQGKIVGDVDPAVRERRDITITPERGGVGPLTYTVLFDHLIEACLKQAGQL